MMLKVCLRDFPGGPVVKTAVSLQGAQVWILVGGTKIPCLMAKKIRMGETTMTISRLLLSDNYSRLPSATLSDSFLPQKGSGGRRAKVKALQAKSAKCPLSPQSPSSSGRPVTAPRAQLWAPLLSQWSPNPHAQPESSPESSRPRSAWRAAPRVGAKRHAAHPTSVSHFPLTSSLRGSAAITLQVRGPGSQKAAQR